MTKGFTRVNRQECDFYVPNDDPKTIWVSPFAPNAIELDANGDYLLQIKENQATILKNAKNVAKARNPNGIKK